jgi:NAD-dependent dihydropyrimidine dehydrogenase PreA subunit
VFLDASCERGALRAAWKEILMPRPIINSDECSACGICVDTCPNGVLDIVGDSASVVNEDDCVACGDCMEECPMGAIEEIEED